MGHNKLAATKHSHVISPVYNARVQSWRSAVQTESNLGYVIVSTGLKLTVEI